MSHAATNWAIGQRGLKPAAKLVLWHLADHHNPSHGCFPSQELLAHECEMSRSTLNLHLKSLEESGLIERVQSRCAQTRKQRATRYMLGFEKMGDANEAETQDVVEPCPKTGHGIEPETVSENDEKPCPKTGKSRVRNSDSNLVREPVSINSNERESAGASSNEEKDKSISSDAIADVDDPSKAAFKKRVQRFCNGETYAAGEWTGWAGSSLDWIAKKFASLSIEDRKAAETWRDAYLREIARQKLKPVPVGKFFEAKQWEALSGDVLDRDAKAKAQALPAGKQPEPDGWANAWGAVFNAALMSILLQGRQDGCEGQGVPLIRVHIDKAYPRFAQLMLHAEQRSGVKLAERYHALKDHMEFVPRGDVLDAWRDVFKAREWVWPSAFDGMDGAHLPKGGPDNLTEFETLVRVGDDASKD